MGVKERILEWGFRLLSYNDVLAARAILLTCELEATALHTKGSRKLVRLGIGD